MRKNCQHLFWFTSAIYVMSIFRTQQTFPPAFAASSTGPTEKLQKQLQDCADCVAVIDD